MRLWIPRLKVSPDMHGGKTEGLFLNKNQSLAKTTNKQNKKNPTPELTAIFSTSSSEYLTFSYENQSETQRTLFSLKKKNKQTKLNIQAQFQILTFTYRDF